MERIEKLCERFFSLQKNGTSLHTEILAGATTFATMSYVLATIPNLLSNAGLPKGAVLTTLIVMIAICSIAMALYTNRPIAMAPGMSSVAVVASITHLAGIPIEVAFGLVFLSGLIFSIISFVGLRELVLNAIPANVKFSISAGVGLFIALIGLEAGDIIVAGGGSLRFGDLNSAKCLLYVVGFVVMLILEARRFRGSMIISVLIVTLLAIPLGETAVPETMLQLPEGPGKLLFRIDILGALRPEYFPYLFTFFVPDFFGTMGIILGIANRAGWQDEKGNMPGIDRCFKVDSLSTVAGSFCCMPVMTSYLESASGVEDGGRTGLTTIVTSIFFYTYAAFNAGRLNDSPGGNRPCFDVHRFTDVGRHEGYQLCRPYRGHSRLYCRGNDCIYQQYCKRSEFVGTFLCVAEDSCRQSKGNALGHVGLIRFFGVLSFHPCLIREAFSTQSMRM